MASRFRAPLDIRESSGLAQARRLAKADTGPPPKGYRPPVQRLPGKRVGVFDGQLDLDGNEHGRPS